MNVRSFFFLVFFIVSNVAFAQNLSEKIALSFHELEQDLNLKNGMVSLTVMDANSGEVVFAKNEQIGLAPASTLKTITTITAYSVLGEDFRYKTDLSQSGQIDENGILHGDIILIGSGDPTLGSHRYPQSKAEVLLARWVAVIKEAGIKKIKGRVIGDDRLFNGHQAPKGWTWSDMGNYYGAGLSSLNWRENAFKIVFESGTKVGEPVKLLRTEPEVSYLKIVNEVTTGPAGSGDQVYAYSAPYSSVIYLRGSYASDLNKKIEVSMPDGGYDVAFNLRKELQENGVVVEGKANTTFLMEHSEDVFPTITQVLDTYYSPRLCEIADRFNKISINLYGEALLKTIALHVDEKTTTDDMVKWEQNYWNEKFGIDLGEIRIRDGSGLSPETRVSTLAMTTILNYAKLQPWFSCFYENLPVYNGMKMKSGTISNVLGYAGYQKATDGTELVFSLLINNHLGSATSMRQKMFKVLNSLK